MNLDIADTSQFKEKMEIYQQSQRLFAKEGFTITIAKKILKIAWLTPWDAYHLFYYAKRIPDGGTFLEIKSWKGGSLLLAHEAIKKSRKSAEFITIGPNVDEQFFKEAKSVERLRIIQFHAEEARKQIPDGSVDLLFIDGARDYTHVKRDMIQYFPKLKKDGMLLGHDYTDQKVHRDVVRAAKELFPNLRVLKNSRIYSIDRKTTSMVGAPSKPATIREPKVTRQEIRTERKYDIIIPYFHLQKITSDCIQSIIKNSKNYRIIATADGSTPTEARVIAETLKSAEEFVHLVNPQNLGFPGNTNRGLRVIDAEYVVVINNDLTVRANWLEALEKEYCKRGSNCFIGAAGANVSGIGGNEPSPTFPQVDYIGWSVIFSGKKCFNTVGLLDESFSIGYYEDVDFGLRAKRLGLKCFVFPPPISHLGGRSMNTIEPRRLGHARNLNLAYLKKKWNLR